MSSAVSSSRFLHALTKLEFLSVIERVVRYTSSTPGRALVQAIKPSADRQNIEEELHLVSEVKTILASEGELPLDGIKDISGSLKKLQIENHFLSAQELLAVASTLRTARSLRTFLVKRRQLAPALALLVGEMWHDAVLEYNITDAIDEAGRLRDDASKDLRAIRNGLIEASDHLRRQLIVIMKRVAGKEFLQEEIITTRDGRMVIPVKVEHKNKVPGFIHSTSVSGATVYVEPAETLELNNTLRELQLREERETERILRTLSHQVQEHRDELARTLATLARIDCLTAKAKYAIEVVGNRPVLSERRRIRLLGARHPVLLQRHTREEVVPLDVEFGEETTTLVITGPNAGGKSVAMKTVGLLSLCVQAGLHIPAASESEFPIFEDILVDIGDEQSIENDLSTFSSHLIRLKEILVRASERTLVLLDEIGAGTDPAEGGALAAVVLEALTARRALTIATTHHGTLKAFAHETPGMANASLEFDQRSLRPTYRFRMGIPGSSYALELAERIGLSKQLIAKARVHLGEERSRLEHLLLQLELKTQEYERQLSESTRERLQLQQLLATYEERLAELRKEVQVIKKKAKDEANEILLLARATVERVVKEIREQAASSYAVRSAKEQLRSLREELKTRDMQVSETRTDHEPLQKGDQVRLKGGTEIGEVQELRKHDATVVWKHGTLKVRRTELEKVDQEEKTSSLTPSRGGYNPQPKAEIDLRGMYGDEAVQVVQRILDEAVVANLHRVDIIHGKGTGALRKRVTEFLKTSPVVKSFRLGEWNEGGSGVTVVELGD